MKHCSERVNSETFVEEFVGNRRLYDGTENQVEEEGSIFDKSGEESNALKSKTNSGKKSHKDQCLDRENCLSAVKRARISKRKVNGKKGIKLPHKQRKYLAKLQEAFETKKEVPLDDEESKEKNFKHTSSPEVVLNPSCNKELIVDHMWKETASRLEDKANSGINSTKQVLNDSKKASNNVHMQRRILANARERSRVHKLGEAFNMLRRVIPSYTADQKLSKLSILKIAINYISALGSLLDYDTSTHAKQLFESSVNECTYALQSEFGRAKGVKGARKTKTQDTDSNK
ncbi:uncharacterized protein LOC135686497 [Rhopilema esculentum]|uniref:uncharacterized protein LOC135686497 n=1 Tax=Rhopilema esculentum TaxID=499914 RepID=UPI0031D0282F|eukprot:gene459-10133_t